MDLQWELRMASLWELRSGLPLGSRSEMPTVWPLVSRWGSLKARQLVWPWGSQLVLPLGLQLVPPTERPRVRQKELPSDRPSG